MRALLAAPLARRSEVAGIVQANGGDEITVAAALLHDAIEDQGTQAREQICEKLGQEVLAIVEGCIGSETFPRPPWSERKAVYLNLIATASLPVLLVMVADKLQNGRALLRRIKLEGAKRWGHPSREEKLAYFNGIVEAMHRRLAQLEQESNSSRLLSLQLLIEEYASVVAELAHQ